MRLSEITPAYPTLPAERNAWIEVLRPARNPVDPYRPYAYFVEDERSDSGEVVPIATVFLTNRECPWRCVMCDLWRNTLEETVPAGAIPSQIDYALARLPEARQIKLYNSGSFFDPRAVPPENYDAIADRVSGFDRVIVECHPALINESLLRFRSLLSGRLEVAMGLETAHPEVLHRLNKRMTLDQFSAAARYLGESNVDLRVFILVQPPFMLPEQSLYWAERSLDLAFDCGATAVSLIPTRGGNGAMEALKERDDFRPPTIELVEAATRYGLSLGRGRVFVDLWDFPRGREECISCSTPRISRLQQMNLRQAILPGIACKACGSVS